MSSGKCKLKRDTTTYLVEWPKPRTPISQNDGKDMEQQDLFFIAGRMQNGIVTLEDSLADSYKIKHILPDNPEFVPLDIFIQRN